MALNANELFEQGSDAPRRDEPEILRTRAEVIGTGTGVLPLYCAMSWDNANDQYVPFDNVAGSGTLDAILAFNEPDPTGDGTKIGGKTLNASDEVHAVLALEFNIRFDWITIFNETPTLRTNLATKIDDIEMRKKGIYIDAVHPRG